MTKRRVALTHTNIPVAFLNKELLDVMHESRVTFTYIYLCAGCGKFSPEINPRGRHIGCGGMILVEADESMNVITCVCC